jgi:hypothetical protein
MGEALVPRYYPAPPPGPVPVRWAAVVEVLRAGGVPEGQLLAAMFTQTPDTRYYAEATHRLVAGMPGFPDAVVAHVDQLSGRFTAGTVEQRLLSLVMLSRFDESQLAAMAPHLAVAATSTAVKVRDAARPLLLKAFPAGAPALRELAVNGKPEVRAQALELLLRHGEEADREFARRTGVADRTERIRTLVDTWDGGATIEAERLPPGLEVPAKAHVSWRVDVTAELREAVAHAARQNADQIGQINRQRAQMKTHLQRQRVQRWGPISEDPDLERRLLRTLGSDRPPEVERPTERHLGQCAASLSAHPSVTVVAQVKVLATMGALLDHRDKLSLFTVQALETLHARSGEPDLLTLQQILDEMGQPGASLVWDAITSHWQTLARGWPDEHVWPFLVHNIEHVVAHARAADCDYWTEPAAFYRLVATLPAQPPLLVEHLYGLALGPAKTHRAAAQQALRSDPDRTARAAAALTDGKADVRAAAATWLARIADPESLPALEKAVGKEKQDVAKGAMLDALEALGRPVEAYLDRDQLASDAEKAVAKGLPKDLDWLSWERLPELHWSDSGERVPLVVVQHLVGQAVRAKSPEPNAILRKYVAMTAEGDRQAFAHALLVAWIAADVAPISDAEAQQRAHQRATSMHRWMQRSPATFQGDPLLGRSVAELTAHYLPAIARTPAGSVASSKGVLAVVAAAGGRDVVPPTERYLKEWYGQRAAQGKALIRMLAWVRHPSATQLLLSIGSRFRTKSFQVEATRQVELLAEREGWTVAELADRTVPTAGFGSDGRLELSYGDRSFTAQLLPDLSVELRNEDGAIIKSLPAARQSDDADEVKAAKAAFTAAKKELKTLASLQQRRLYEALCTDRTWSPQDWQRFLAGHPVMRLLCQRLVWVAEPADGPQLVFRLLDDGTLSDVDDNEVELPQDGVVRLAHDTNLTTDEVEAWLVHLSDYEVQPLFQQLGKGMHTLSEELRNQQALEDFKGHTLGAFALRNRALKLGWTRGPAEDGGWFHVYLKRFPTLGLAAQLAFTGNPLPEENRTVGLLSLGFVREVPDQSVHGGQPVALGDVPAVLLSETWHDVRSIAAEGGGYDLDWERSTEYR